MKSLLVFLLICLIGLCSCTNGRVLDDKTKIVLSAERHDFYEKFEIQLEFLKNINNEKKVKHILFEQPYTTGIRVKDFFETGDSLTLKEFLLSEAEIVNKDHNPLYNFYRSLYAYFLSLDENKRFELQFVDIETFKTHNIQTWIELLSKTKNRQIVNTINQINYKPDNYESSVNTVNQLKAICSDESMLENHNFKDDLLKIKQGFSIQNRDSLMYIRVLDLLKKSESGLIFGQFGAWHICRENKRNLINLLEKSEFLKADKNLTSIKLNFTESNYNSDSLKNDKIRVLREVNDESDDCKYDLFIDIPSKKGQFLR